MSSKLQNGIDDPKGLENKIYTMMKGRETFYGDHTVPITSCSEVQYVLKRVISWKQGLYQRTENCRVYECIKPVLVATSFNKNKTVLKGQNLISQVAFTA